MTELESGSESPVKEGDVLAGKYRVEKVLGVGGMGVVVAAMHTELDERVALKFLLPAAARNPAVVARFSREARAAAKIKSQHVSRVSDVGTLDDGTPYIVMEYLAGQDLSEMLAREQRLSTGVAIDYVLQACEAIAEAHAAGFVHRDLKPGNLFLANQADGTAIIKVLDFGISKALIVDEASGDGKGEKANALTRTSDVFGSPMYMSPEQLKATRDVDPRSDIWAIGVILYELVSGRSPFDRETVAETFGAILYERPEPLRALAPNVPDELERIIGRCLEKDASLRFPNVAELCKALFPFAKSASRASLDRTSRVLRRAGVTVESLPPATNAAAAPAAPAAKARTGTTWTNVDAIPRPRSSTRGIALGAGAAVVATVALVGWLKLQRSAAAPAQAARPEPALTATEAPVVTPTATVPAAAAPEPTATVAPIARAASAASAPTSAAPLAVGRAPRVVRAPKAAPALPTSAPAIAPPPRPAKPAEDTDGFGGRK